MDVFTCLKTKGEKLGLVSQREFLVWKIKQWIHVVRLKSDRHGTTTWQPLEPNYKNKTHNQKRGTTDFHLEPLLTPEGVFCIENLSTFSQTTSHAQVHALLRVHSNRRRR